MLTRLMALFKVCLLSCIICPVINLFVYLFVSILTPVPLKWFCVCVCVHQAGAKIKPCLPDFVHVNKGGIISLSLSPSLAVQQR